MLYLRTITTRPREAAVQGRCGYVDRPFDAFVVAVGNFIPFTVARFLEDFHLFFGRNFIDHLGTEVRIGVNTLASLGQGGAGKKY